MQWLLQEFVSCIVNFNVKSRKKLPHNISFKFVCQHDNKMNILPTWQQNWQCDIHLFLKNMINQIHKEKFFNIHERKIKCGEWNAKKKKKKKKNMAWLWRSLGVQIVTLKGGYLQQPLSSINWKGQRVVVKINITIFTRSLLDTWI
jgi:hypothetical protein